MCRKDLHNFRVLVVCIYQANRASKTKYITSHLRPTLGLMLLLLLCLSCTGPGKANLKCIATHKWSIWTEKLVNCCGNYSCGLSWCGCLGCWLTWGRREREMWSVSLIWMSDQGSFLLVQQFSRKRRGQELVDRPRPEWGHLENYSLVLVWEKS